MANNSIAVILSGCGHQDGSEIHEATLTLLAIHTHGADYQCYAPNITHHHVLNHADGNEMDDNRNVYIESARISRGNLKTLDEFSADNHDALIIPGGLGAAKNLSTFAFDGENCIVNQEVKWAISSMVDQNKPIGALCIAPVILANVLDSVTLTIGNNPQVAEKIEQMGAIHQECTPSGVVVDEANKIVTTPCYMYDSRVNEVAEGVNGLVAEILRMVRK